MDPDEYSWKDADGCHGRVIGYDEVRLEQGDGCPADVAALVEAGSPARPHSNGIDRVIDANPAYLTAEQAVDAALVLLDAAAKWRAEQSPDGPPAGPVADDDHDRRWRLHVHAASIADCTFWVERHGEGWKATEVETGVTGALGSSVEQAIAHYFAGRLWGDTAITTVPAS
jgi:hypothetical protein